MADERCETIAGYPASWRHVTIDVTEEADGASHPLPCDPISLYTLEDPQSSIDAAALLREPVISDPPYWALVWTGAQAIAASLSNRNDLAGKRVLDLGCGLGLSGLAAARRGAHVTFGDYLQEPLEFVRSSLARAQVAVCTVRSIDFTRDDDDAEVFDLILAADIVYDPAHYVPLALYLDRHLAPGGTILLTESLRADAREFVASMQSRGFDDRKTALRVLEDGSRERTWLHELRRN